jgi:hypothetical protein
MGNWFGHGIVGDLNGEQQERYTRERIGKAVRDCELAQLLSCSVIGSGILVFTCRLAVLFVRG